MKEEKWGKMLPIDEDFIKKPLDTLTFATENKEIEKEIYKQLGIIDEELTTKLFCLNGLKNNYSSLKYLELRAKAVLQKTKITPIKKAHKDTSEHPALFEQLKDLRASFADVENVPHYAIFTQKSLYDLCEMLPLTHKQLLAVNGMGKVRVEKYGDEILDVIKEYCDSNSIEPKTIISKNERIKKEKPKKEDTKRVSLQLFKNGLSIFEIAKERNFTTTTIEGHLAHFIPTGEIKITDIMQEKKFEELKTIMQKATFENFTELKNKIDDKFSYSEIRLVASTLEIKA